MTATIALAAQRYGMIVRDQSGRCGSPPGSDDDRIDP